jgi:soluble lytic murein transglycosylase
LPSDFSANRMQREMAALAIQRIARNDPRQAAEQLGRVAASLAANEKGWAWSQIAWQAAQRHLPEAMDWYRQAGDAALSEEVAQWKVRAAAAVGGRSLLRRRIIYD